VDQSAHFAVNTRLTRILGETYRSSEAALKELVDNAWDADATNVWISLPEPLMDEAVIVQDDGAGMTAFEIRGDYLNIASDKRTRTGERTPKYNRKIKGRIAGVDGALPRGCHPGGDRPRFGHAASCEGAGRDRSTLARRSRRRHPAAPERRVNQGAVRSLAGQIALEWTSSVQVQAN